MSRYHVAGQLIEKDYSTGRWSVDGHGSYRSFAAAKQCALDAAAAPAAEAARDLAAADRSLRSDERVRH